MKRKGLFSGVWGLLEGRKGLSERGSKWPTSEVSAAVA